jgi:glyoxylase-like metal-dependent hydrolase (beta-lactamase superfamily II)
MTGAWPRLQDMRNTLAISADDVGSIERVARGVAGLRIVMVNVFAITAPDRSWTLVDAGLPFSAERIRRWCGVLFGRDSRPSSILLTHGHFDHVGSFIDLAEDWDVPVYAHSLEMPYLTGLSKYPPPDPTVGGGAFALMSPLYPRGPIDLGRRARTLPQNGGVPGQPEWRWIHTPGHTAGHVSLFREYDRVLIAGDAFVTTKQESMLAVATQRPEMHGPPAYYTSDWNAANLSVRRLAALRPLVAACGHGLPMHGPDLENSLAALAENFDEIARPAHGRYVRQPAVTDERGVVWLPPPAMELAPKIALGAAVGIAAWLAWSRRKSAA